MDAPVRDITLDSNGNRVLANGDYAFASGPQAVKQGIQCSVGLILGEYWLNTALGVDYLGKILIKNPSPVIVRSQVSAAIAVVPDVTRVVSTGYTVNAVTRQASLAYSAASIYGPVTGTVNV